MPLDKLLISRRHHKSNGVVFSGRSFPYDTISDGILFSKLGYFSKTFTLAVSEASIITDPCQSCKITLRLAVGKHTSHSETAFTK